MRSSIMRGAVRKRLVELITAEVPNEIKVSRGFPGQQLNTEHIWVSRTTGTVDYVVTNGLAIPHDDEFTITVVCMAAKIGQKTTEVAEDRVELMASAVITAAGGLMRVDDPVHTEHGTLLEAVLGDVSGPDAQGIKEGFAGFMTVDVDCHTRSTYEQ